MSQLIYLSRNFVEFGPFTPEEIQAFKSRSILGSTDFLKADGSDDWIPAEQWSFTTSAAVAKEPAIVADAPASKPISQKRRRASQPPKRK